MVDNCTLLGVSDVCCLHDELNTDEDSHATEYLDIVQDSSNNDMSVSEQLHDAFSTDTQLMTSDVVDNCTLTAESDAHLLARRLYDELDRDEDSEVPITGDLFSEVNAGMSVIDMINVDDDIHQTLYATCKQPQNMDISAIIISKKLSLWHQHI